MKQAAKRAWMGYVLIAIAGALWGTGGTFVRILSEYGVPSYFISFLGHVFTLLPLALILLVRSGKQGFSITRRGLMFAIIIGAIGKGLFVLVYNQSITLVGVSTASVLLYLSPLFTTLMSVAFLNGKVKGHHILALAMNLLGCVMVVTRGQLSTLTISGIGLALGLLSAFIYALTTILGKIGTSQDDPITMTFYMMATSSLFTFPFAQPWLYMEYLFDGRFLTYALLYALLPNLLANMANLAGLSMNVEPGRASVVASIEIVVANLLAVVVLNEPMNGVGVLGVLILFSSIVLMNVSKRLQAKQNHIH